ncbi:MAG: isocitrate lyase/PEP mutase family protein [Terriglobia bacterium]
MSAPLKPTLVQLLKRESIVAVPASFDMVSAKLIERAGFDAVYLSGYGHSASHLGLPDAGLISFSEMLERLHHLVRSVSLPVIADGDTGYGGSINIRRTIQEFEATGAQAIQIEDQEIPKKCGHTPGKRLIEAGEMAKKLEAAIAARRSDHFLVIARTDALSVQGLDEAVRRARLYQASGADILFIESPLTLEQIRQIPQLVQGPIMINQIEGGKTPLVPIQDLQAMGYKLVAYALTALMASVRAIQHALKSLRENGTPQNAMGELASFAELDELLGFPEVRAWEERFR